MAAITVKLKGGGELALTPVPAGQGRWQVTATGGADPEALARAREVVGGYSYRSGHGYPGYYLAEQVARAVGGEAVLPPVPPVPPGVVP